MGMGKESQSSTNGKVWIMKFTIMKKMGFKKADNQPLKSDSRNFEP
jgi:hypothetical protein